MIPKRPRGEGPAITGQGSAREGVGKNPRPWKDTRPQNLQGSQLRATSAMYNCPGATRTSIKKQVRFLSVAVYLRYDVRNITPATGSQCETYETYLLFSRRMSLKSRV